MQEPPSTESRGFDDCVRLLVVGVAVWVAGCGRVGEFQTFQLGFVWLQFVK